MSQILDFGTVTDDKEADFVAIRFAMALRRAGHSCYTPYGGKPKRQVALLKREGCRRVAYCRADSIKLSDPPTGHAMELTPERAIEVALDMLDYDSPCYRTPEAEAFAHA